jgi:hypothetical protein
MNEWMIERIYIDMVTACMQCMQWYSKDLICMYLECRKMQSFSDLGISSDSDCDWSSKFGLGLGLGLKKLWLSFTLTQNYQSMKYLWRFNYSRYLCMWFIKGIIGFEIRKIWNFRNFFVKNWLLYSINA